MQNAWFNQVKPDLTCNMRHNTYLVENITKAHSYIIFYNICKRNWWIDKQWIANVKGIKLPKLDFWFFFSFTIICNRWIYNHNSLQGWKWLHVRPKFAAVQVTIQNSNSHHEENWYISSNATYISSTLG